MLCIFLTNVPRYPHWPDSPSLPSPSLAHDNGELGDSYPKGHGAHGTMSVALWFGCEGTRPCGPSGTVAGSHCAAENSSRPFSYHNH